MSFPWTPISEPIAKAKDAHNIIVVGSGYGGGVAASRLARAGQRVTVLERGREIAPGDYPRTGAGLTKEIQVNVGETNDTTGKADALFDLRVGGDISVLVGCGLGGTSLINANVAIEPDPRIFEHWPAPYSSDANMLDPYFARARKMLGSTPYPADKTTPKLVALEEAARGMGAPFSRPDINVSFTAGPNAAGVQQAACTDCGDCVSGCNYGAKNTVLMNYLPDAKAWGAHIYTGAQVSHLIKTKGGWTVVVITPDGTRELTAKTVVLAAGTLGSTEILLRSAEQGLPLSKTLGQRFSGNGDVYAFGFNANLAGDDDNRAPIFAVGAGPHDPDAPEAIAAHKPGPCIAGMIDLRDENKPVSDGILIEDGVMPGAFAAGYATAFPAMAALMGDPMRFGDTVQRLQDLAKLAQDIAANPGAFPETAYDGPVSRTMPYLVMSHDGAGGQLALSEDKTRVDVVWKDAGLNEHIVNDATVVREACDAIGAEYLPMPLWQDAFGNRLITVHPLGGCAMGQDAATGVVNADCAVFDTKGGVHAGLYVCDGSVIPGSIGVNPHLTITAVSERAIERFAMAQDWTIDWSDTPARAPSVPLPQDAEFDPIAVLDRVIDQLQRIRALCRETATQKAKVSLAVEKLWRKVREAQEKALATDERKARPLPNSKKFAARVCVIGGIKTVVLPVVEQALDALIPIRDAVIAGKADQALTLFQETFGDVSPAGHFDETMTGHLGPFKTPRDDKDEDLDDPFAVAAKGQAACTFKGHIGTNSIQTLLETPDTPGFIEGGTLESEALGGLCDIENGEFRFLVPNKAQVDCWNMIYSGTLKQRSGGKTFEFTGTKTLKAREGSHWWRDLTVLAVEITDKKKKVAKGQISVSFENVLKQARELTVAYGDDALLQAYRDAYDALKPLYRRHIKKLPKALEDPVLRSKLVKFALLCLNAEKTSKDVTDSVENAFKALTLGKMGALVMRNYGGIYSYLANFPAHAPKVPQREPLQNPSYFYPQSETGVRIKLTRYKGGKKGPVILAGGFGTKASSFALPTVDENIVETLMKAEYDVWLFDYRGSGDLKASLKPFTLDDVALKDWPAAISTVVKIAKPDDGKVQTLVHCIGSMTLFMAILAGEDRVRSVIASQLATHAITNWLNYAKADSGMAKVVSRGLPKHMSGMLDALPLGPAIGHLAKSGVDVLDPCSPSTHYGSAALDLAIDGMLYSTPAFGQTPCKSPTCHRITAIFGPSYNHDQLNQETHDAIADLFGPLSSKPFEQIAQIYKTGHVVGETDYMGAVERLNMPIHLFSGALNQEMPPEATLRTLTWLKENNKKQAKHYSRKVYQGFGHMDCFIGQNARAEIFDDIVARLTNPKKVDLGE